MVFVLHHTNSTRNISAVNNRINNICFSVISLYRIYRRNFIISNMNEQTGEAQYLKEYNSLGLGNEKRIEELLRLMLAECGENCYLQPPFYANWGGAHLHLGNNVYANFNLTAVDDGHIYLGRLFHAKCGKDYRLQQHLKVYP